MSVQLFIAVLIALVIAVSVTGILLGRWCAIRFTTPVIPSREYHFPVEETKYPDHFDFPVNVPNLTRDDQITLANFFSTPTGKLLILRLRAICVNMALAAGENKQYGSERAAEAHGFHECLKNIQSISVVPTASDTTAPNQEDEVGEMLKKYSP